MCLMFNVTISVGDVGQGLILVSSSEGNRSHMETRVRVVYIKLIRKEIRFDLIHLTTNRAQSVPFYHGSIKG